MLVADGCSRACTKRFVCPSSLHLYCLPLKTNRFGLERLVLGSKKQWGGVWWYFVIIIICSDGSDEQGKMRADVANENGFPDGVTPNDGSDPKIIRR